MKKAMRKAAYLSLTTEELRSRVQALRQMMASCTLCPRNCRVNRIEGKLGMCRIGPDPVVSSYGRHFGEEGPLVGTHGSGTIFLTGCNLHCTFCQNYEISRLCEGDIISTDQLARMMISLQNQGCHNINLVTPTHQITAIIEALGLAVSFGLRLPIVYNCGGYESVDVLRLLDSIVDIYMPDMKYADNQVGSKLSGVPDYWERNREAVREMHRQVGDLEIVETPDGRDIAVRGLLVRHLVLPNRLAGMREIAEFIAVEISTNTYINIMDQYRPCYRAIGSSDIGRPVTAGEYSEAVKSVRSTGLWQFNG